MAGYRRYYDDDLAYGDDYTSAQRWDRDRFQRERARSRGAPYEIDSFRFEETDRIGSRGGERRKISVDERVERRGPRYEDQDRYYDDERYRPPRRPRPEYVDEEFDRVQVSGRELAPYPVRREYVEAEYAERPAARRPSRPTIIRRQSSLDTYDRRPLPKYDDREIDVKIKVEAPRRAVREEARLRAPEPELREEDYREVRIKREKSTARRGAPVEKESREIIKVEEAPVRRKKGKTRFPRRLCDKQVLIDLGYTYEEEEDFFIVQTPLWKDEIDEVIKRTEGFREKRTEPPPRLLEAPPPELIVSAPHEAGGEVVERVTTKIIENPTREDLERYALRDVEGERRSERTASPGRRSRHGRSRSRHESVTETFEETERIEEIGPGGGQIVLGEPVRRKERDIKAEIRALELEARALRIEREAEERRARADRARDAEYARAERLRGSTEVDIVERRESRDVVRVERDRRGKLNLVRSAR